MTPTQLITSTPVGQMSDRLLDAERSRREEALRAAEHYRMPAADLDELREQLREIDMEIEARRMERAEAVASEPPVVLPAPDPFDVFARKVMHGDVLAAGALGMLLCDRERRDHFRTMR